MIERKTESDKDFWKNLSTSIKHPTNYNMNVHMSDLYTVCVHSQCCALYLCLIYPFKGLGERFFLETEEAA